MATPTPSNANATVDESSLAAAIDATQSALPFVEWLSGRFAKFAHELRNGADKEALERLSDISNDLKDFFEYIILMSDMKYLSGDGQALRAEIQCYQRRLASVLESINPALDALDLVEVADIVEHEIIEALAQYADLHEKITVSLAA